MNTMINIYTIGVYNSTEEEFYNKLLSNNIDLFCDIRQRRGVRGSLYKFVNSNYLQSKLQSLGIKYLYIKELAPTNDIRQKQKDADKINHETKKQRTQLGEVFAEEYKRQILSHYDFCTLENFIKENHIQNMVFFCVEEKASACHRSLVAAELSKINNVKPINL